MKARNLRESFKYAGIGIVQALKSERNMRIHWIAAIAIGVISILFKLSAEEAAMMALAAAMVITAEMVNTAIEHCVDLVTKEYDSLAAEAKNVAAGAVLVSAVGAVVVGVLILGPKVLSSIAARLR
ncbi:MAG: diacylglycerol kinase family protein [Firmicutes bacterium]|nr:diacylglycerol kinase family protein [Bacillota bacterium]MDD4792309.1 diacylglycerol kinase family protein [Bacillota bacterium]